MKDVDGWVIRWAIGLMLIQSFMKLPLGKLIPGWALLKGAMLCWGKALRCTWWTWTCTGPMDFERPWRTSSLSWMPSLRCLALALLNGFLDFSPPLATSWPQTRSLQLISQAVLLLNKLFTVEMWQKLPFLQADTDQRLRRALLRRYAGENIPLTVGQTCFFWRDWCSWDWSGEDTLERSCKSFGGGNWWWWQTIMLRDLLQDSADSLCSLSLRHQCPWQLARGKGSDSADQITWCDSLPWSLQGQQAAHRSMMLVRRKWSQTALAENKLQTETTGLVSCTFSLLRAFPCGWVWSSHSSRTTWCWTCHAASDSPSTWWTTRTWWCWSWWSYRWPFSWTISSNSYGTIINSPHLHSSSTWSIFSTSTTFTWTTSTTTWNFSCWNFSTTKRSHGSTRDAANSLWSQ